jgi:hypothetical protein
MLRPHRLIYALAFMAGAGLIANANAAEWADYATVSMTDPVTPKLTANRLCYTDGRDVACDGAAGLLSSSGSLVISTVAAGGLSVTGNTSLTNVNASGIARFIGVISDTNQTNLRLTAPGTAQIQNVGLSFYPTFDGSGSDNGPRRVADILAGFNGGAWGHQYLSFNVGDVNNDTGALTAERMRITANGSVGIGTSTPSTTLYVNGNTTLAGERTYLAGFDASHIHWLGINNGSGEPSNLFMGFVSLDGLTADRITMNPGGSASSLIVVSTGLVGINLSRDPVRSLEVSGTISATNLVVGGCTGCGGKGADRQVFTVSGTWTKPSGYSTNAMAYVQCWGGGGGGGRAGSSSWTGNGGGGGAYRDGWFLLSTLGATETVTIGAGGGVGTAGYGVGYAGGNSRFGSKLTAYGGGGGGSSSSSWTAAGQGGQLTAAGTNGGATGNPITTESVGGDGGQSSIIGAAGGASYFGGSTTPAGTSSMGGNGGGIGANGSAPGGGGGGAYATNGGYGAAGQCIVSVFN